MSDIFTVKDQLAGVTAKMDQVQSEINLARFFASEDQQYQLELDRKQEELNATRERIALIRDIADIIYPK